MAAVKQSETDEVRKLRGGYYTPPAIANYLTRWAIAQPNARVLEPSAGEGEFLDSALSHLGESGEITAIEYSPTATANANGRLAGKASVIHSDFFSWFYRENPCAYFDAVIGNPPFIRYQNFKEEQRTLAFKIAEQEGVKLNRLTNIWVPFVIAATRALRIGGRIAMVLPAELLQVTYAKPLRDYLLAKYSNLKIITFKRLVFDNIQQEVVLLLGKRADTDAARIQFTELDNEFSLSQIDSDESETHRATLNGDQKWVRYFLSAKELELIEKVENSLETRKLGEVADVDVGIVTGRNEFFVLDQDSVRRNGLEEHCLPLVGRSAHVPGVVLTPSAWQALANTSARCFLFQAGNIDRNELSTNALKYIEYGEESNFHRNYKCSVRLPRWWNVPGAFAPDAFLLRQIYDAPRMIVNEAGVTCTDTIHRVRFKDGFDANVLAYAMMNSMTCAFAEILGRSYGGGVLELEPTEAEKLPIPIAGCDAIDLADLNGYVENRKLDVALDAVDRATLKEHGLSQSDIHMLRSIWKKLSNRRMKRSRRS